MLGFDLGACLAWGTAAGYDAMALALLLPAIEAGMMAAIFEQRETET
ncbi:MAG: hypothetical protein HQL37_14540 [Alphaproteobacteria bacterium]|nr:hypothetical protein [Alphaproteobacteria bacterium]